MKHGKNYFPTRQGGRQPGKLTRRENEAASNETQKGARERIGSRKTKRQAIKPAGDATPNQ